MIKEKEELLSSQVFHNWKNHQCTKILAKILEDSKKSVEDEIQHQVLKGNIDVNNLYILKGAYLEIVGLLDCITGSKEVFEKKMEVDNES